MNLKILNIGTGQSFRIGERMIPQSSQIAKRQTQNLEVPDCSICCQNLLQNLCVLVPCGHVFHNICIKNYQKLECPICRQLNDQVIPVHFSIELNVNSKGEQNKQNKLIENQQYNSEKYQNQIFLNKLRKLVFKGKEQIDHCYKENIWSDWNQKNDVQKFLSCDNLHKEISKILIEIRNEIDNKNSFYNENNTKYKEFQVQQQQNQQTPSKPPLKGLQKINIITPTPKKKNYIDITDRNPDDQNQNQYDRNGKSPNPLYHRSHSYNKQE